MEKLTKREDVEDIFGFGNWWIKKELFNYMVENKKELGLENLEFSKNCKDKNYVIKIDKRGIYLNECQARILLLNKVEQDLGLDYEIGQILFKMLLNLRILEGSTILEKSKVIGKIYQGKVVIKREGSIFKFKIIEDINEMVEDSYEEMYNVTMYQVWTRLNELNSSRNQYKFNWKMDILNTDIIISKLKEDIDIDWELVQHGLLDKEEYR